MTEALEPRRTRKRRKAPRADRDDVPPDALRAHGADPSSAPAPHVPRTVWLAVVLNLVLPSFGTFYAGFPRRAFLSLALLAAAFVAGALLVASGTRAGLAGLALFFALDVAMLFDAAARARQFNAERRPLTPMQRPGYYAGMVALVATVALGARFAVRHSVVEAFKIPGGSMIPTVFPGDHIFVSKLAYALRLPFGAGTLDLRPPARGDVMVFQWPERPDSDFLKRAVAVGGDVLEVLDGRPILNGWIAPHCYVGAIQAEPDRRGELYVEYLGDRSYLTLFNRRTNLGCRRDSDCDHGRMCSAGHCRPGDACRADSDCAAGAACASDGSSESAAASRRFCRRACSDHVACGALELCETSGHKECAGSHLPCNTDLACGSGSVCMPVERPACISDPRAAEAPCESDEECASGERCRAHLCGVLQGPYSVAPREVWVLGDNRDNSHDSRAWFDRRGGGVPFALIKGRALLVWLSPDVRRLFLDVMGAPQLPAHAPAMLESALAQCLAERPVDTSPPSAPPPD